MLLYFVLLLKNVFHSQYIPYVSYFHIYVFLFCDDELYMLKSNKTSVLFLKGNLLEAKIALKN